MELSYKLHSLDSFLRLNGYGFSYTISSSSITGTIHNKDFNIYSFWFSNKSLKLYDDNFLFGDVISSNMYVFKSLAELEKYLTKKVHDIAGLSSFTFI